MRRTRGLAVCAGTLALLVVVVSAGSAVGAPTRGAAVRLALLPLQKAQLGSTVGSLELAQDSGIVSDSEAAAMSFTGTPKTFAKLGRITGYALDYGDSLSGGAGVTEVWSSGDKYKNAADAAKGLAFWRGDDPLVTLVSKAGFVVKNKRMKVPAVGASRYAYLTTWNVPNTAPLAEANERFVDGRYVLDVSVFAGTAATATALAPRLAKRLDRRLRLLLGRRLRGKPVKLPPQLQAGPPVGGPDLEALTVQPSDLTGQVTVQDQGYDVDPAALSDYNLDMRPAGPFSELAQEITWYPTANEATWRTAREWAEFLFVLSHPPAGVAEEEFGVDLSGLGDGAQGLIVDLTEGGQSVHFAEFFLARGQATDFVSVLCPSHILASEVLFVAEAAVSRLNAGVPG